MTEHTVHFDLIVQSDGKLKDIKRSLYPKVTPWFTETFSLAPCSTCCCEIKVNLLLHKRVEVMAEEKNTKKLRSTEVRPFRRALVFSQESTTENGSCSEEENANPQNTSTKKPIKHDKNSLPPMMVNIPATTLNDTETNFPDDELLTEFQIKQHSSDSDDDDEDDNDDDDDYDEDDDVSESPPMTDSETENEIGPVVPCTRAKYRSMTVTEVAGDEYEESRDGANNTQSTDAGFEAQNDEDFVPDNDDSTSSSDFTCDSDSNEDEEPTPKRPKREPRPKRQKKPNRAPKLKTEKQLIVCNLCYETFTTFSNRNRHKMGHDLTCKFCDDSNVFKNAKSLQTHLLKNHKEFHPASKKPVNSFPLIGLNDSSLDSASDFKQEDVSFINPPNQSLDNQKNDTQSFIPDIERTPLKPQAIPIADPVPGSSRDFNCSNGNDMGIHKAVPPDTPQSKTDVESCASSTSKKVGLECQTCLKTFINRKIYNLHCKHAHVKKNLLSYLITETKVFKSPSPRKSVGPRCGSTEIFYARNSVP